MKTIKYKAYRLYGLKYLTAFFLIVVYTNIVLTFAGIEIFKDFHENRKLADLPAFNLKNTSYNSFVLFVSKLESYINDHFTFRKPLIMAYNSLKYYLFNASSTPVAMPGKNGWFFYGMKNMQEDYERKSQLPVEYINRIESSILNRHAWLAGKRIPFMVMITPNTHNIYYKFVPNHWQRSDKKSNGELLVESINRKLSGVGVNIFPALRHASKFQQVYYKIDTHWNHNGSLIAVETLLKTIKTRYPNLSYRKLPKMNYKPGILSPGNFGRVMGVPLKEIEQKPVPDNGWSSKSKSTSDLKNLLPERSKIKRLVNHIAPKACVLVIGDSYMEVFDRYLAEAFSETIFVNLWDTKQTPANRFPIKLIKYLKPDLILFMMAERRIGDHPTNGYFYDGEDPTDIISNSNLPDERHNL